MKAFEKNEKPRIGLYSTGLEAYWSQFPTLHDRLKGYGTFIEDKISQWGEVYNFGIVDNPEAGKKAGDYFNENKVDLIFCHAATYCNSASILPIHQRCNAKVVILNLQPAVNVNYEKATIEEWLAHCGACPVPEYCNAFNRAGIDYKVVSGLLGLAANPEFSMSNEITKDSPEARRAWQEIENWVKAATVKRTLMASRIGFLGNTYNGMLDMYSDFAMIQAQTGVHVEVLEMDDLDAQLQSVTEDNKNKTLDEIQDMFEISEDSPSEKLAKKPTQSQLDWSATVASAQDKLINKFNLNGLTYYYHGSAGSHFEQVQSGFIVGNSLLTSKHVPCAGEGDLKTDISMKICDILGLGGSFCEIVVADYNDGTILLGHDGPFHLDIAEGKPKLRGLGVYHGKQGTGVSVEAKVKTGPITTLGLTQTIDGKLKLIISEGISTDGPIMKIGNTQTPVKFTVDPDTYFEKWFALAPTHHCAMSIGKNTDIFKKVGYMLDIETVEVK
ncbi:hypothetical protein ACFQ5M_07700 [Agrilactobacillus yilanensis]|uniref:Arabinose isomerase n=1 Tax=Agrilactobacillus yilanensis TaxID=2485997 RepID=A0ABW4J7M3_9LACO|nr:L-fucose/L-arabinose isomerase family protein [Agrilactobacillus yilanensis]